MSDSERVRQRCGKYVCCREWESGSKIGNAATTRCKGDGSILRSQNYVRWLNLYLFEILRERAQATNRQDDCTRFLLNYTNRLTNKTLIAYIVFLILFVFGFSFSQHTHTHIQAKNTTQKRVWSKHVAQKVSRMLWAATARWQLVGF